MAAHKGRNGTCSVCKHADRAQLELLVASGVSLRAAGRKFGCSRDAVRRHWTGHVTAERKAALALGPVQRQALAARLAEEESSVIDNLRVVRAGLFQQYSAALDAGDRTAGAMLAGRLHENLRTVARITGELASSPLVQINNQQNNITALMDSPQFAQFQATLIRVLGRFPDARDAVVVEFERLARLAAPVALPAPHVQSVLPSAEPVHVG